MKRNTKGLVMVVCLCVLFAFWMTYIGNLHLPLWVHMVIYLQAWVILFGLSFLIVDWTQSERASEEPTDPHPEHIMD